ncbi:Ig-like domain repeat protein [Microbacterium wangchenii]|uniref:GH16 domain-containing protein n=1 Tax=Microbacterium wangchenii TaxID=2541726 RepID=A0ABX5SQF7_9MICO|nr:Ig-like domain repeat protein [Microbacterium wangchenii]QBR88381.1 hypothetical protein E4K62_06570 [Microbacterium wangchenii]
MTAFAACAVVAATLSATPASGEEPGAPPVPSAPPAIADQVTGVLLDDDFDGVALDSTVWTKGWFGNGADVTAPVNAGQAQCYDPDNVTVSGGEVALDLTEENLTCGGVERAYAGGMINSYGKFTVRPGSFLEARVYLPGTTGAIENEPTVWMQGRSLNWPSNGTVVLLKGEPGGACASVTRADGASEKRCAALELDAWHTVGAHWKVDGTVDIYYDGMPTASFALGTTDPMYPILNVAAWPNRVVAPSTFAVDYVRAWDTVRGVMPAPPVRQASACGIEPVIVIPELDGVSYTQARTGNELTVTAEAALGYSLTPGAQTEWVFDVTPLECPPGGGAGEPHPLAPPEVAGAMTSVLLDDGFDAPALDASVWNRGWVDGVDGEMTTPVNVGTEIQCYDPDNIRIQDGSLELHFVERATECERRGTSFEYDYAGAMIQSWKKFAVGPGSFVEARMRTEQAPHGIANWPAFWLNGESHNWPHTGEIDVMEGLAGQACASVHGPDIDERACLDVAPDAWHVYGAHWRTDGNIDFYYDGVHLATHYLGTTDRQYLILNLAASNARDPKAPSVLAVDYVRAWDEGPSAPDEVRPEATLVTPSSAGPLRSIDLRVDASDDQGLSRIVANVYRAGTLVRSTQSAVDGAVSATHTASVTVPDGEYTVKFNAHDAAGNVSRTGTFDLVVDSTPPTAVVKNGDRFTVQAGDGYDLVSFKLHDAGKIDRIELNGTVKDLSDDAWSDLNFIEPGVFGAIAGVNSLVLFDVAGNSQTVVFTLT